MDSDFTLFPKAASTIAGRVDALYLFLVGLTILVTALIAGLIVYYAVKYRRANQVDRTRPATSIWVEVVWILAPLPILLLIFFWGAEIYFAMVRPPANTMKFTVVAKQWMWKFQHPTGQREIDALHVPVGQPVRFTMISQDVIHSMYVPAFRVKMDVLPGRYTTLWFEATEVGEYHLFCAEYCGTKHASMRGKVVVMTARDYQDWLSGGAEKEPPAVAGQKLFEQLRCGSCHLGGGTPQRGPALHNLFGRPVKMADGSTVVADETYLRQSIVQPQARTVASYQPIMPSFAVNFETDEEGLLDLIAYLKAMNEDGSIRTEGAAPPPPKSTK
ncbi:MAG: cytochrome c oxidase subunit II [Pirellulaceae bacterium]